MFGFVVCVWVLLGKYPQCCRAEKSITYRSVKAVYNSVNEVSRLINLVFNTGSSCCGVFLISKVLKKDLYVFIYWIFRSQL